MALTAKDFVIEKCSCPMCGRPAAVYSRDGHKYLRCMWVDCRLSPERGTTESLPSKRERESMTRVIAEERRSAPERS